MREEEWSPRACAKALGRGSVPQARGPLIKWSELGWRRRTGIGGTQILQGLVVHVKGFVLHPNEIGSYSGVLSRG